MRQATPDLRHGANSSVAYSIADESARERVERAIAIARLNGESIAQDRLVAECERRHPAALIYDLHPVGERTVRRFLSLKQRVRYLPVLIYPPAGPGIVPVLVQCSRLPLVQAELQGGPDDITRLSRALQRLMAVAQTDRLLALIGRPLGTCAPSSHRFVEELVTRLRRAAALSETTVAAVARDMGTTARTLERQSVGTPLAPRELRDWIILLLVGFTRDDRISLAAAAEGAGIDPQRFYRIRARLIGERFAGLDARGQFQLTYHAFRERCRVIQLGSRRRKPTRT